MLGGNLTRPASTSGPNAYCLKALWKLKNGCFEKFEFRPFQFDRDVDVNIIFIAFFRRFQIGPESA